jgi:hypothetical protein
VKKRHHEQRGRNCSNWTVEGHAKNGCAATVTRCFLRLSISDESVNSTIFTYGEFGGATQTTRCRSIGI